MLRFAGLRVSCVQGLKEHIPGLFDLLKESTRGGGGGDCAGPRTPTTPPPPKGPPANSELSKVPAQGADGRQRRPIVHKHQKHYPKRLTWGEI